MTAPTPDLCDRFAQRLRIAAPLFQHYGGISRFDGQIATIKCFEDNSLVRDALAQAGLGRVLVIDGGGSLRRALLGDQLAQQAVDNGWAGVIINGCLRDVDEINDMALGVRALACHPMKTVKRGEGQRDLTLHFADIDWRPGAHVYVDNNGIVVADQALQADQ